MPLPAIPHLFAIISEMVCSLFPNYITRRSQSVRRIDVIISVGLSSHIAKICCHESISKCCHVVRAVDSLVSLMFKRYSGTSCGPFTSVAWHVFLKLVRWTLLNRTDMIRQCIIRLFLKKKSHDQILMYLIFQRKQWKNAARKLETQVESQRSASQPIFHEMP